MAYDGLRTLLEMENRTVNYTQQLELILRLLVASLCGFAIGYERTNRLKEAGIRTHMIVAVGSALVMIVSKYGFFDVMRLNNVTLDPSRIAAQIVTGIGFLGAGTILVRRSGINGLTTPAGLWATAAVGMAVGAKLYIVGVATTAIVLLIQIVLHQHLPFLPKMDTQHVTIVMDQNQDEINALRTQLRKLNIHVTNVDMERKPEKQEVKLNLWLETAEPANIDRFLTVFAERPGIKSLQY